MLKKKYRLLDHKIDNMLVPNNGIYFRVASFLNNPYGQRLQSDKEISYEILQRMHAQKDVDNTLATEAEVEGWIRRKTPFKTVTADEILDLPEISERDLTIFFAGSFQLSKAVFKLTLEYVKEEPNVLEFRVQSRHLSRASNSCFIRYKNSWLLFTHCCHRVLPLSCWIFVKNSSTRRSTQRNV